jgi:CRISPR system Cascade subunit CasD
MPTLLLRCIAPLQSWGTQSHFSVRDTGREPSKSGIVGLLCAALGRPRSADVTDLTQLRMGVRVDREGTILREWQTALTTVKDNATISTRYYLNDAIFLVGLESASFEQLENFQHALRKPQWNLFLGRKSCPPAVPPFLKDGVQEDDLLSALQSYPWLGNKLSEYQRIESLRLVLEDPQGAEIRRDVPVSFADRSFQVRKVRTDFITPPPFWRSTDTVDAEENSPCIYRV